MNIFKILFSFKGTISRLEYVLGFIIGSFLGCLGITLTYLLIGDHNLSDGMKITEAALCLSCFIFMIVVHFALSAKRLRDLQWSQWLLVLTAIPVVSLYMLIIFLFIPGKLQIAQSFQTRPWVRFFARYLDIIVIAFLFGLVIGLVNSMFHLKVITLLNEWSNLAWGMMILFLYVFIEPFFFSIFGTTFGKWMFNVHVKKLDDTKLSFADALVRGLKVWWFGLAMGLPIINIFTQVNASSKLTANGATTWDQNKFLVSHGKLSISKLIVAILIFVSLMFLIVVVDQHKTPSSVDEIALVNKHLHLPKLIDKETEFTSVTLEDKNINYNYRLINIKIGDIEIAAFEKAMHKILLKRFCHDKDKKLIENSYPILFFNYNDKNGDRLATIPIVLKDCQSENLY